MKFILLNYRCRMWEDGVVESSHVSEIRQTPGSKEAMKPCRSGAYRRCSPLEALARVTPFLSSMGITRIANITGLDNIGIPVVMVCRPNSRGLSVSQGKGLDLDEARVSGIMEAAELFHAENIDLPLVFETYARLRRQVCVAEPNALPGTSDKRFHPNLRLFWIEGHDLLNDASVWVPNELVHADFRLPRPRGAGRFLLTTGGLAAGNEILEAIIHGICEVIERDSGSLWDLLWPNQRKKTKVRLETVDDPACRRVLQMFKNAEVAVAAWNITSDLGIPAFVAHIIPEFDDTFRRLFTAGGYGCHASRDIALLRALLEAAQSRLTVISGARDDVLRSEYVRHRRRGMLHSSRSRILKAKEGIDFQEVPTFDGGTSQQVLDWLLERLRRTGIQQVIAVDLTKSQFGIPVVRIVIPYLEGDDSSTKYSRGPRANARLAKRRNP
jgi:ribosomal protein S12 methylthiotransferase accessory factor